MSPASTRRGLVAAIALLGAGACFAGCAAVNSSEAHAAAAAHAREGDWFVKTGCTACHSVSVYDMRSVTATGPDLSVAVEDVPKRFGRSLEDFLSAPTGTMAMVLSEPNPPHGPGTRRRRREAQGRLPASPGAERSRQAGGKPLTGI